ncbi:hypothetical protein [Albimonas pacifica]|uniref:DUF4177 domain-containing protein n=1 Tax=Albimonas pacifica TaxID=1114924 RepID=A0A1I3H009_9RHOB|nr:hypothetical protein [Albimonas pacifica]SFI28956.1 hypothetical protein SAMN05216258_105430 [Albimonas pacifica]
MSAYEYKTVAAPRRAGRYRGVAKGAESFARTIEEMLSSEAIDGWEFLRAENLPCEEKHGWLSRRETVFHSVLVFRRVREQVRPAAPAPARDWAEPGFGEPAPAFQRPEPAPAPAPQAQGRAQGVAADPDAAMMRLEPEMRDPAAEGPRLGPADR